MVIAHFYFFQFLSKKIFNHNYVILIFILKISIYLKLNAMENNPSIF